MATSRSEQIGQMARRENPGDKRALELMKKDPALGKGRAQVKAHQQLANEQARKSQ